MEPSYGGWSAPVTRRLSSSGGSAESGASGGGDGGSGGAGLGFLTPPPRKAAAATKRGFARGLLPAAGGGVSCDSSKTSSSEAVSKVSEPESEPFLLRREPDYLQRKGDLYISNLKASSKKMTAKPPVNPLLLWFARLEGQYGIKLLLLLWSSQHLLKGMVNQLQASSIMWLLQEYNLDGSHMQIYSSVGSAAWALKPVLGAFSDLCPIFGYRKAPYVIGTSLVGVSCALAIGLSTRHSMGILGTVLCLFGMSLQASTCDLLTEAKYSQRLHEKPSHGPDLITYVWGGVSVGNMLAIASVGWIMTRFGGARAVFLACICPSAAILVPTACNFFEEVRITKDRLAKLRAEILKQSEVLCLCGLMTLLTFFLSAVGMASDSHRVHLLSAVVVLLILVPSFHVLLRPEIAKVNTFFVLQASLSLTIGGATFYFYTDGPREYPQGPHFSTWFYVSTMGMVSATFSVVGLAIYAQYMKNWSYRALIFFSNFLVTVLSLLDAAMFARLNLRVGIPDVTFVLGSSVMTTLIRQWQWMPGIVILSQLCPKGMEATMFSLLAGCANLGGQIADYLGAYMLSTLDIHPIGAEAEARQFDNLWKASCVATMLPAITILLIPVLIPSARQTDKLLLQDPASATSGSLLRILCGT